MRCGVPGEGGPRTTCKDGIGVGVVDGVRGCWGKGGPCALGAEGWSLAGVDGAPLNGVSTFGHPGVGAAGSTLCAVALRACGGSRFRTVDAELDAQEAKLFKVLTVNAQGLASVSSGEVGELAGDGRVGLGADAPEATSNGAEVEGVIVVLLCAGDLWFRSRAC